MKLEWKRDQTQKIVSRQKNKRSKSFLRPEFVGLMLMGFWTLCGAIATLWNGSQVQLIERQTQRFFIELRGQVPPPNDIVILAIDDESLTASER